MREYASHCVLLDLCLSDSKRCVAKHHLKFSCARVAGYAHDDDSRTCGTNVDSYTY